CPLCSPDWRCRLVCWDAVRVGACPPEPVPEAGRGAAEPLRAARMAAVSSGLRIPDAPSMPSWAASSFSSGTRMADNALPRPDVVVLSVTRFLPSTQLGSEPRARDVNRREPPGGMGHGASPRMPAVERRPGGWSPRGPTYQRPYHFTRPRPANRSGHRWCPPEWCALANAVRPVRAGSG